MTQPTGNPHQGQPGTTGQGTPSSGTAATGGMEVADPRGMDASNAEHTPGPGDGSEYRSSEYPVSNEAVAQHAYEAYSAQAGGKSLVSGDQLPEWEQLSDEIKQAWHAVAEAVRRHVGSQQAGHRTS